jgi:beta-phosphoglucomutase-like phosphatase (HAD superfamily)
MIKGLIFDMDGTILNTIEDCMDEVRAEIDENNFNSSNVCLTNTIPTKLTDTEQLKAKHEKIRTILIENGNDEFGDCIIDEICEVVGILPTTEYYEE